MSKKSPQIINLELFIELITLIFSNNRTLI